MPPRCTGPNRKNKKLKNVKNSWYKNLKFPGFLCTRRVPAGLSYQPFYADDSETAKRLIIRARNINWPDENVLFQVPTTNTAALALIKKYYLIDNRETSRNTWLSCNKMVKIKTEKICSILDYCFSVC